MDEPLWMWIAFLSVVIFLLLLDLGVIHRKVSVIGVRESLWTSAFYVFVALVFGGGIYHFIGLQAFKEYVTGFVIEKSLSVDNIFIISLAFSFFKIPLKFQHRVLFWGILGVIFLRGAMILLGAKLVAKFAWILYVFAVFLIFTGVKLLLGHSKSCDVEHSFFTRFLCRWLRITSECHDKKFFLIQKNPQTGKSQLWCTPLFAALVLIEFMDLIFAVDSVPAIFAITTDSYVVYTSNIFAILGLRALYFALAAIIHRFFYLKYALALVLIFIGSKVFIAKGLGLEKFPATISLAVTFILLSSGVLFSLYKTSAKN